MTRGVLGIVVVLVAVFVVQELSGRRAFIEDWSARWDRVQDGQVWLLVSGTLLHSGGAVHIAGNLVMLVMFGPTLERLIGLRWLIVLMVGGGALAWLVLFAVVPNSWGNGSSSGITAMIGAGTSVTLLGLGWRWHSLARGQRGADSWRLGNAWSQATYGYATVVTIVGVNVADPNNVGFAIHIGGYVAGLVLGIIAFVTHNRAQPRLPATEAIQPGSP